MLQTLKKHSYSKHSHNKYANCIAESFTQNSNGFNLGLDRYPMIDSQEILTK